MLGVEPVSKAVYPACVAILVIQARLAQRALRALAVEVLLVIIRLLTSFAPVKNGRLCNKTF
jgi:hypothetical protein